jgi:energy-coupling factor transport system permease protein
LVLALVALARVPLGFALGGLRPALPFLVVIAILQLLFGWGTMPGGACRVLWSGWIFQITDCSVQAVIAMILRLVSLILLTSLLTLTSTTTELTHGIERMLRPFQRIGVPAHELAMVFMLALRFVPTLAEELEKLLKAQAARGADIRLGSNPVQRTRHLLPVLVPLFLVTLRRGDELVEAMTARGYMGGRGRTHYVRLHFGRRDALALALAAVCSAILVVLPRALGK